MNVMKSVVLVCLAIALSGCASNTKVVRCDRRLEPINLPAPRVAQMGDADSSLLNEPEDDRE